MDRYWTIEAPPISPKPMTVRDLALTEYDQNIDIQKSNVIKLPIEYKKEKFNLMSKIKEFLFKKNNVISIFRKQELYDDNKKLYRICERGEDLENGNFIYYYWDWSYNKKEIVNSVIKLNKDFDSYHKKFNKKGYYIQVFENDKIKSIFKDFESL